MTEPSPAYLPEGDASSSLEPFSTGIFAIIELKIEGTISALRHLTILWRSDVQCKSRMAITGETRPWRATWRHSPRAGLPSRLDHVTVTDQTTCREAKMYLSLENSAAAQFLRQTTTKDTPSYLTGANRIPYPNSPRDAMGNNKKTRKRRHKPKPGGNVMPAAGSHPLPQLPGGQEPFPQGNGGQGPGVPLQNHRNISQQQQTERVTTASGTSMHNQTGGNTHQTAASSEKPRSTYRCRRCGVRGM